MVITAVAIPIPLLWKSSIANAVAKAEAPMFTALLPTRIVPNSLLGSSLSLLTKSAPLIPSFCMCLALVLLKDVKAVSDAEKKAEKHKSIIKAPIFHKPSGSRVHHSSNVFLEFFSIVLKTL